MAGDDQLGAGVDERAEDCAAARDRPLPAPPGRAGEVVVERDDAQRAGRRLREHARGVMELARPERAALVPPRPDGVESAHDEALGAVHGLHLGPVPLELGERTQDPRGRPGRDVVVPGDDDQRPLQRAQEPGRPLLLLGLVPVGEIAGREHDLRVGPLHQLDEIRLDLRLLVRSRVEVGNVEQPEVWHRAGRL